jgi:hypothetical protein
MSFTVERFDAREWPEQVLEPIFADAFPPFIGADKIAAIYIDRVREYFADFNIILLDETDQPVAWGWGVPIAWDGELSDLPTGYTDTTRRAVDTHDSATTTDTFVICGAIVDRSRTRQGIAGEIVAALRDLPAAASLLRVIVPVRPTLKPLYPLTPINTFASWTRSDGLPLDPWLRTHRRLGGRIIATAPQSQVMTGTIAQWEEWTQLTFPSTGEYIIPNGLQPLHIDREENQGTYTEPNVWIRHR